MAAPSRATASAPEGGRIGSKGQASTPEGERRLQGATASAPRGDRIGSGGVFVSSSGREPRVQVNLVQSPRMGPSFRIFKATKVPEEPLSHDTRLETIVLNKMVIATTKTQM